MPPEHQKNGSAVYAEKVALCVVACESKLNSVGGSVFCYCPRCLSFCKLESAGKVNLGIILPMSFFARCVSDQFEKKV